MAVKEQKEEEVEKIKVEILNMCEQHFIELQAANYK